MSERILQIWRGGKKYKPKTEIQLLGGYQGNLQTLKIMADMVRGDRTQKDLRNFVERHILNKIPGHHFTAEIKAIFDYCQQEIIYRKDPVKVERVADLWSCLYALNPDYPEGDCGIKSVALATMLALFGHNPAFAIIKQDANAINFNHVYCEVEIDGEWKPLDPTPEDKPAFWEAENFVKERHLIFP